MTGAAPAPRLAVPEALDPACLASFDPAAAVVDLAGETMGTGWSVRFAVPRAGLSADLQELIEMRLASLVAEMSHWDEASALSRFNQAAAGTWLALPAAFARVIAAAADIHDLSGGAFDPAIGRLTDIWGLGPRRVSAALSEEAVAEALGLSGWRRLSFDRAQERLLQPGGVWLDLSGIAKGFAVDMVADLLAGQGVVHALVEIGGECAGRGLRPDGDPWWVDVESPPGLAVEPLRVALHQLAIATSGDYLAGAHNIDPFTGQPAIHQTTSATVIHSSCMVADGWSSALTILPPDRARALAEREGIAARLIQADGAEWISSALQRML